MATPLTNYGYVIVKEIEFPTWGKGTILWKRDSEELWFQRLDGTLKLLCPSGTAIAVKDEGITLTGNVSSLDFIGLGVTATAVGDAVTIDIPGGGEFYYQDTPPVPINVGARWIDSDDGFEYVWIFDGTSYYWIQPTQDGVSPLATNTITTATATVNFAYQYYGVLYTGGICTVTLPLGVSPTDNGKFINIADEVGNISYGNRGILVQGQGGQLINGEPDVLMKLDRMSLDFMFRGGAWKTI